MSVVQPGGKRTIDVVLSPEFVVGIDEVPLAELRNRRAMVDREESWLSYLRRMLHGRMDILEAQLAARDSGGAGGPLDLQDLVAVLADQVDTSVNGPGRPTAVDVMDPPGGGRRREELALSRSALDNYPDMSVQQMLERRQELRAVEQEISDARSRVHQVYDLLTAELTRRYRSGEVAADAVLRRQQ